MYDVEWYCKILSILSDIVKYLPLLSNYIVIAEYNFSIGKNCSMMQIEYLYSYLFCDAHKYW